MLYIVALCIYIYGITYIHTYIFFNLYHSITPIAQVHPEEPGQFAFLEFDGEILVAVEPSWGNVMQGNGSNICHLESVMVSNRERLYARMCDAVLAGKPTVKYDSTPEKAKKVPFEVVPMAADGMCGWRGLLASQDLCSFLAVPRIRVRFYYMEFQNGVPDIQKNAFQTSILSFSLALYICIYIYIE